MALETGTYISDLNSANPTATDDVSEGDDHIRLLKSTILATFPNITGEVTATQTEINQLTGSLSAVKGSDEGVTNSAALQDDDDLTITLAANSTYYIESFLVVTATNATPDIQVLWVEPDGEWQGQWVATQGSPTIANLRHTMGGLGISVSGTSEEVIFFRITAQTGGAGGTFKLQWAQNVATAGTTTTIHAGSWLSAKLIA